MFTSQPFEPFIAPATRPAPLVLMATKAYQELENVPTEESIASSTMTFTNLLLEAAKRECGRNITLRNFTTTLFDLDVLKDSLCMKVLHREEKPTLVGRTIVDISTKEYKNYGAEDVKDPAARDTTKATVTKYSPMKQGRNYQFISTQGVMLDVCADVGLKIISMGMGGGSTGLAAKYGKNKSKLDTTDSTMQEALGFEYSQEETVCVPPGKKVHVTTTTYTTLYRQRYTLEFSVPKWGLVYVSYRKSCLCGLCTCKGSRHIPFSRIVRSLPNFREDNQNAYFTQEGFLSWIGESCEVDKKEASVYTS